MTDAKPAVSAEIRFRLDESYRQSVRDGDLDDWIQTAVAVGGTWIYGSAEEGVTGHACTTALGLIDSVRAARSDERYVIEFEFGPTWLVVEPRTERSITVTKSVTYAGTTDPEQRLDVDTSRPVTKTAWRDAVVDATQTLHETVIEENPALEADDSLERIRAEIDRMRER